MANNKYISIINNGSTALYIKDAEARQDIEDIKSSITGGMHYIGKSTTEIEDGSDDGPWVIDGTTYITSGTPTEGQKLLSAGDIAIYGELEFIWSGASGKWQEFGSTGSLKALAFKDNATGSVTAAGNNASSQVTFESGSGSNFVTGFDTNPVAPSFTEGAFSAGSLPSFTEGTFTQGTLPSLGEATTGTFATEGITMTYVEGTETLVFGTANTSSAVTAQGTFNAGTLPTKAADSFNAGSLPSKSADTFSAGTVPTLVTAKALTASDTGTAAAQTFTGTAVSVTVS